MKPSIIFNPINPLLLLALMAGSPLGLAAASLHADIPPGLGIAQDGSAATANDSVPNLLKGDISQGVERILWDKRPLQVQLQVGKERLVTFPGNVRLGIPNSLAPHLRSQSHDGTVYWLASSAFAKTRIQVQDTLKGQFYLVDLSASETAPALNPIEVLDAGHFDKEPEALMAAEIQNPLKGPSTGGPDPTLKQQQGTGDYLTLTRHAAQQLYAPERLLKTLPGIHPAPLDTKLSLDHLIRGGKVSAEAVASWQKGNLYVTAVKLTNLTSQRVLLDPRLIRGQWLTATFQHGDLGPSSQEDWASALYLVSGRPFGEAL